MSVFFRKARALLAGVNDFSESRLIAFVFTDIDRVCHEPPTTRAPVSHDALYRLIPGKWGDDLIERFTNHSALEAAAWIPFCTAHYMKPNFTGSTSMHYQMLAGVPFKNAAFSLTFTGHDARLFESIAEYCGRGIAESYRTATEEEVLAAEYGGHSVLWQASLANLCSMCEWNNPRINKLDDPYGRFTMYSCDNVFQATWDALSSLMLLDGGDGPWSEPDSPSQWAKRFKVSTDTFKRRIVDGKIRTKKLSTKSYRVHVEDLPVPAAALVKR